MGRFRFSAASAVTDVTDGLTDALPSVALSSAASAPAYNAAGTGRRLAGWRTFGGGPNAVVAASQPELLRRARDLKRNNPHAKRALGLYRTHMVGTGVKPQSLCSDPAVRAAIHALWARWTDFADADGGYDFYGLQAQAAEELATAGEVFARLRPRRMADGLPVPLQVQLLPAEQLPLSHTTTTPGGNEIMQGIERDAIGRRDAYWFHRRHPGDPVVSAAGDAWELSRVDAGDVCHLRLADPGQLRGLPWLAPAMTTLKQLADWQDASLHRKQLVTSLVGFVRKAVSGEIDAQKLAEKWSEVREELGDLPAVTLEPGTMQYLDPGEDVEFTNWQETAGADEAFIRASLRSAAAALDVLYEELTGDWSQTNDRTFRAGFATFKRLMRQHQHNLLCFQFNRPVFLRWLDLAVASGALRLPRGMGPADYQAVAWVPERWEYLNPLQDVRAVTAEIDAGLTSRSAAVAERGEDVEVVDAARKGDRERENAMGLAAQSPPMPSPVSPPRSPKKPAERKAALKAAAPPTTAALSAQTPAALISAPVAERLANPYRDGQNGRFTTGPGKQAEAFAHRALGDRAKNERMDFGPVENHAEILKQTGIDLSPKPGRAGSPWPWRYGMDSNGFRHVINHHGDPVVEANRGQIAVTAGDARHVRDIFHRPDNIDLGERTKMHGLQALEYTRTIKGVKYTLIATVNAGRRKIMLHSMWKVGPTGA